MPGMRRRVQRRRDQPRLAGFHFPALKPAERLPSFLFRKAANLCLERFNRHTRTIARRERAFNFIGRKMSLKGNVARILPFEYLLVLVMRANPEPVKIAPSTDRQGTISAADSH